MGKSNQTCLLRQWTFTDEVAAPHVGYDTVIITLLRTVKHTNTFPNTYSVTRGYFGTHILLYNQTHTYTTTTILINPDIFSHTGYPWLSSPLQLDWTSYCYVSVWIRRNYGGMLCLKSSFAFDLVHQTLDSHLAFIGRSVYFFMCASELVFMPHIRVR